MSRYWLVLAYIFLAGAALAQLPAPTPDQPANPGDGRVVLGTILDVNLAQQSIKIAVNIKVSNPDVPGNMPDRMAKAAALLTERMKEAQQQGKTERVQRLQRQITELRCWRQIERVVTPADHVQLVGSRQVPLGTIAVGMRVSLPVRVVGAAQDGQVPAKATLIGDVAIMNGLEDATGTRLQGTSQPDSPDHAVAYMQITGYVVNLNPLTLRVKDALLHQDATVQVATQPQFAARQNIPVTAKDLRPGQLLFADVQVRNETDIVRIRYLNILFFKPEVPLPAEAVGVQ